MKNFIRKARAIDALQDQIDHHVWEVFNRYVKLFKVRFNGAQDWRVEGDTIHFDGTDGCMGCYDPMSLTIDFKYFEDPDKAFEEAEQEIKAEEKRKKDREAKAKKAKELKELKRLKEKYNQ